MREKKKSIADLKIYLARSLEDSVYELVKKLPDDQWEVGNDLRRASAGACHYINEAHERYSYHIKIESLHAARQQAETAIKLLGDIHERGLAKTGKLCEDYTIVIKQSWGLIKWLKAKVADKQAQEQIAAKDELAASR